MPKSAEDVENYLIKLGRTHERAEGFTPQKGNLLLRSNGTLVVIAVTPPIVAVNVEIGPRPTDKAHELATYRKLLELNASDLMHAAYGLEKDRIVLSAALALDNLDENELEATLADIDVALARHIPDLAQVARD